MKKNYLDFISFYLFINALGIPFPSLYIVHSGFSFIFFPFPVIWNKTSGGGGGKEEEEEEEEEEVVVGKC